MGLTKKLLHVMVDGCSSSKSSITNEEVMLASNNPKKRAGRKKFCETRHPIYRGVRRRNSGKWVCELREPNKKSRIWLGTYPTVEMAARAHDVAAIALRGRLACLNFADSSWRLPIPASKDTKDIQKAAAEAAECFRPSRQVDQVVLEMEVDQPASSECVNSVEEEGVFSPHEGVLSPEEEVLSPEEGVFSPEENVFMMDEDDIYSMPWLISSMAEGLMLPPPFQGMDEEAQEHHHHIGLWNF